ncbi:hypothetical protein [Palleronia sp.]|uniref:hypothetical protein n=1 Tax=Palleronia sp. TaxID=1940284 RepID=UPI0035C7FB35
MSAARDGCILVLDCEVPEFIARAAAQAPLRSGLCLLLDPSPADQVLDQLLSLVDVVVPDATEAETSTDIAVDGPDAAMPGWHGRYETRPA